eukprot:jgi/Ulvmu1/11241/UM073_0013.1
MSSRAIYLQALVSFNVVHDVVAKCIALNGVPNIRFCDITYCQSDCVEAGCNYNACDGYTLRRRLRDFWDSDYGGGTSHGTDWICREGCSHAQAATSCEEYQDFDCPLLAGCALAQAQDVSTARPSASGDGSGTDAGPGTAGPSTAPASSPSGSSNGPVVCSWLDGLSCAATVAGEEGETYLLLRLLLHACIADSAADGSGCSTSEMLDFCENGEFQDTDDGLCLPLGSNYTSGIDLAAALVTYANCTGVSSAACTAARSLLYEGMGCGFCAAIADRAAPHEAHCAAASAEEACGGVVAPAAAEEEPGSGTPAASEPSPSGRRPHTTAAVPQPPPSGGGTAAAGPQAGAPAAAAPGRGFGDAEPGDAWASSAAKGAASRAAAAVVAAAAACVALL